MRPVAKALMFILPMILFQPVASAAGPFKQCASGKITEVIMGNDTDMNAGQATDGDYSIWIRIASHSAGSVHARLNTVLNLNDSNGGPFLATILTAATLGANVDIFDHFGDSITCDDWDEIIVSFN